MLVDKSDKNGTGALSVDFLLRMQAHPQTQLTSILDGPH